MPKIDRTVIFLIWGRTVIFQLDHHNILINSLLFNMVRTKQKTARRPTGGKEAAFRRMVFMNLPDDVTDSDRSLHLNAATKIHKESHPRRFNNPRPFNDNRQLRLFDPSQDNRGAVTEEETDGSAGDDVSSQTNVDQLDLEGTKQPLFSTFDLHNNKSMDGDIIFVGDYIDLTKTSDVVVDLTEEDD